MPAEDFEERRPNRRADEDDSKKVHVSRIPTSFDEKAVKCVLEDKLGEGTVEEVNLIFHRPDGENEDGEKEDDNKKKRKKDGTMEHRGFGFVRLASEEAYKEAVELGSVRGGRKSTSSRKHTLYLRPYTENEGSKNTCFLWSQNRCRYGENCKFEHEGPGGLLVKGDKKKIQKCFAFKKGKCKKGDACPYSHDFVPTKATSSQSGEDDPKCIPIPKKADSEKDCINWKTKGKCRKGDKCPYRHDEALREAALLKKKRKSNQQQSDEGSRKKGKKEKQPLWVRVFGLNYATREHDVREFLKHCGPIMEVQFPRFEDSGRSKGYCGVLFQSPKAVAKAVEMDGEELDGRWLRIQAGKMLLEEWESREAQQKENATTEVSNE